MGNCLKCIKNNSPSDSQQDKQYQGQTPQFAQMNDIAKARHFDRIRKLKTQIIDAKHKNQKPIPIKLHQGIYHHQFCPLAPQQNIYQKPLFYERTKIFKSKKKQEKKKVFQNKDCIDRRSTRRLKIGTEQRNLSFTLTSEPIQYFQCQFLLIFTDNLQRVSRNPFINQLLRSLKCREKFTYKLEQYDGYKRFEKEGILKICQPFPGQKILNLYIVKIDIYEGKLEDFHQISQIIRKAFFSIPFIQQKIQVGIIQLAYNFGFPAGDFQIIILNQLEQLSERQGKSLEIIYWAYDVQNFQLISSEIFAPRKQINLKKQQSSCYY